MTCWYFLSLQTPVQLLALDVGSRVSVSVDAIMTPGTSSLTPLPPKKKSILRRPGLEFLRTHLELQIDVRQGILELGYFKPLKD